MRNTANLEEAIRDAGEDWLFDLYAPPEDAISNIRRTLAAVHNLAHEKIPEVAPDLTEASIVEHYNRYPLKVKGFLQLLGGTRTAEMLLMAWRIIQGMEVKEVDLSYHRQQDFSMRILLHSPYGVEELYQSTKIQDFAVFRHIGTMQVSDRPVFDGFYALRTN